MVQFVFALPFLIHGLAHMSGFLASWTARDVGFSDRPWIFSPEGTLYSTVGRIWGILWLIAMAAMLAAGFGLLFSLPWWPSVALPAAVLSLVAIVPWWNTVSRGAKIGAAFDVLVLVVLLVPSLRQWLLNLVL